MNYCGMYNWTNDLPRGYNCKEIFLNILDIVKAKPSPKILEVGTFAGTSITTIKNIIPHSKCYAIDNWAIEEEELDLCKNSAGDRVNMLEARDAFLKNTSGEVTLIENDSTVALADLIRSNLMFDFIYVDGSHRILNTLMDVTLSWILLNKDGILAIDDYTYIPTNNKNDRPQIAVDYFLEKFKGGYKILNKGYRLFLQKI